MDHMKRLRKPGSFYKRAKKYMVSDPVDEEEAGSSRAVFPKAQNEIETAVQWGNAKQRLEPNLRKIGNTTRVSMCYRRFCRPR
uniref:Uncharacterized protein n=1 Tax=Anopheles atroparvus TaxID=41427 RepID=A0AAG5D2L9_ANOAO